MERLLTVDENKIVNGPVLGIHHANQSRTGVALVDQDTSLL